MNNNRIKGVIESLLFFWSDPLDIKSLEEILSIGSAEIKQYIREMEEEYANSQRGIQIKIIGDSFQMVTNPNYDSYIQTLMVDVREKTLSNAMIETLSIIAYKQPVTRIEIDSIRGVNSSGSLSNLLNRGLIEELGKLDRVGRPIIYGTTDEFLRVFGLESIEHLPEPSELEMKEENFETK